MQTKIDAFNGPYRFLSNFWKCDVKFCDVTFPSVEHAYVAAKCLDQAHFRNVLLAPTPSEVKKLGRKVELRAGWDESRRYIMYDLVRQKFTQNEELRAKLIGTGGAILEEGNHWGDTYWGVCNGEGENHLGRILMVVREEIVFRNWLRARPDWMTGKPDWMSWS